MHKCNMMHTPILLQTHTLSSGRSAVTGRLSATRQLPRAMEEIS